MSYAKAKEVKKKSEVLAFSSSIEPSSKVVGLLPPVLRNQMPSSSDTPARWPTPNLLLQVKEVGLNKTQQLRVTFVLTFYEEVDSQQKKNILKKRRKKKHNYASPYRYLRNVKIEYGQYTSKSKREQ